MTLPLRWRLACAVSSLLAVATLATPADGAPVVNVVTLNDAMGDTRPIGNCGQADILTTTAAYKPAEITFTAKTGIPENPAEAPNWNTPTTGHRLHGPDEGRRHPTTTSPSTTSR